MKTIIDLLDTSRAIIKNSKDDVELKIGHILITQAIQLLQKGYTIHTDIDGLFEKYDVLIKIPEVTHDDEITKLTKMVEKLLDLTKLNERVKIFLSNTENFSCFEGYQELEKAIKSGCEINWDKIEINNHIDRNLSHEDVYNLITEKNIENENNSE
mgnify:CR=1 FL=1|tara:strand:- start:3581 stop:4048 length:468 start_codon:yes stop_codon:yes gene_type:complete